MPKVYVKLSDRIHLMHMLMYILLPGSQAVIRISQRHCDSEARERLNSIVVLGTKCLRLLCWLGPHFVQHHVPRRAYWQRAVFFAWVHVHVSKQVRCSFGKAPVCSALQFSSRTESQISTSSGK